MSRKHGLRKHRFYQKWKAIRYRCYNPNDINYKYYGSRGIKMQSNWIDSPVEFIAYLESLPNYFKNCSLDRIDNNKGYIPGNLRWATRSMQSINTRIANNNTSGLRGISKCIQNDKFRVQIHYLKRKVYDKRFNTKIEALKARNKFIVDNNLPHKTQ